MLDRAITFAAIMHEDQFDKGGEPYILHCLAVMMKVPKEYRVIAVLHDVVEDCGVTVDDLYNLGLEEDQVHSILLLSKFEGQTLDQYKTGIFSDKAAMIVKMADLEHNSDIRRLKGITEKDLKRIAKYHEFYTEIKERLYG
jgi:GTP diphosphokinase / guanosine-3',5'-bis(diphosphate) 3'-diphosphatase